MSETDASSRQTETPPDLPFLRFDAIAGRGGMATVWRAWHRELRRPVAVKVLDADFATTKQDVNRFLTESQILADLHHPGIVQGYGAGRINGRNYFLMDFVDGYTFGALLKRKGRLTEPDALIICESVASAMQYAWNTFGIVHCDIKPENIMADRDGTVKVMDLGLCRFQAIHPRNDGTADEIVGTPAYLSPEQIYADVELDCRADIYSLGATLYHFATGRTLFPLASSDDILRAHVDNARKAPDPRTLVPELDEGFCRLIAGMLVKDREVRYQAWEDVLAATACLETGEPLPPLPADVASSVDVR